MRCFKKLTPEWILRIFLGAMFLYSGYDIFIHPTAWTWAIRALPGFVISIIENTVGVELYLRLQGASEILLSFVLLAWFLPRRVTALGAIMVTLEMFAITLFVGLDAVTFRDIGLIGAGSALFVLLTQKNDGEKARGDKTEISVATNDDIVVEVFKHEP
jgi:uncharacterized membrane protein YphA (DoxX/SURF4 family)